MQSAGSSKKRSASASRTRTRSQASTRSCTAKRATHSRPCKTIHERWGRCSLEWRPIFVVSSRQTEGVRGLLYVLSITAALVDSTDSSQRSLLLFACSALVLLMSLGAALFYLRPSRVAARRVFASAGLVAVLWVLIGYGLTFGSAIIPGFLGNPFDLISAILDPRRGDAISLHTVAFALFQGSVVVLTVTIICSVVGERLRLAAQLVFVPLWMVFVYAPIAYSVFNTRDGWLFSGLQIVDQAGGTVVHISAGAALLALVLARSAAPQQSPFTQPRTLLVGTMMLWVGAFGFNVGSEGVVDGLFGTILINTLIAPALAAVAWAFTEMLMRGRPTLRGGASGVLVGIAAIAPACGILTPLWTALLALLAGAACAAIVTAARGMRHHVGFSAAGIHLVGGILGVAYIGLFGNGVGWKDSGQPTELANQASAALGVAIYSFIVTFVIVWLLNKTVGAGNTA
ncbi:MAG: hypothetical protein ABI400_10070, partial [Lacisediminihabitans sp.]